ncbi:immunoglobulin superfamily member 6 isoform X2 [Sinocyclocheilus rhinocerous]|uniref:immunoglobulin superfamily member 6 isoform X1 n=1 Tax=Sinocyclocheilus rhinocerous TaxID=307959 RepID=UPI0007B9077E|nr:PREDICTED: immunoglobulin superfamily member 6 isoform X1 [Sinocyclocheilus rhinocerous]XP_016394711.1 PREDICTED: immunoglobulin superfamily member 6 isoform X2 [Sinocyclocheilus rhinocerous]
MNFGFFFTIAFLIFSTVSGCKVDVQQPTKLIRKKEQQSVSIPCSVTVSSCPKSLPQISWYVFRKNSHYQLDLKSHSLRYTLEHQGLKISSLSEADSGVYYCAAALLDVAHNGAQAIGQGTTLKVSETGLNVSQALLLTLLVLLTVYSLLVLVIIICIKTGQFKSVFKRRWSKSENKEDSARQLGFSGVVQELSKRNLVGGKIQAYYKVSQDKSTGLQNRYHSEDVYQNLDE